MASVRVPPRWVERLAWRIHRGIYRLSRGHLGLWRPRPGRWGSMRLIVTGRRSGQDRAVILAYLDDGPNLVTLAMNGWWPGEPLWWLNLQAHPAARVQLKGETRQVRGRPATGDERDRLWAAFGQIDKKLDEYAALRPVPTAVVVLEPA
ncbi:nitroreductase/quinone reductase family protein [Actinoplanes sp. OR16]|uniref:nitroreductase/quinone reductase family protein n=1 Tax=Actinoplanes sp. OR16 TaxID=946334 RepID=UPI000FD73BC0|nr:nitroreductase/quinone reductase family protein [Actinoplanes sp. OR16]